VADVGGLAVTYVTDPWCPWSWAAEPAWRSLLWEFGADARITYVMAGMGGSLTDPAAAAREWLDAAAASGQPADPRVLLGEPPASTQPAALAVKAVAEQADPGPFLRRLREAIFLERRRVDRGDALLDLAREAMPGLAVDTLKIAFGSHGPVESLGADLDRAAGLRAPLLEIGGARVDGRAPYGDWRAAALEAGAPEPRPRPAPDAALRHFGACTTAEVAAVCDLPGPRAPAELWRLALEFRARPRPVLGGELWSLA